ncbi:NHLP bacteriocin system secretion protein [Duganella sp. sic0402]|uniref:NHLP bacteriocin system secretion protein n=1 Tax=Duganella sp. sic0402 TaxID=2854786 RepID=UPI001C444897|nr:NHLP bacteriocin system secretion protein [Duganella sp. sic0402]MBV7539432.1 NHLP bacteriocin system secretion protein [Duganella sp. sic0402]
MASPDRLDMGARLVTPASGLLLSAALLIVAACLAGSILIRVPVKAQAQGMLTTMQGVKQALADRAGPVRNIRVRAGEHVRAGQVIADIGDAPLLTAYTGTVAELTLNDGDIVEAGGAVLALLPDAPLIATVYASTADGKNIHPGMRVELAPSNFKREEYGFVSGRVVSVAPMPATPESMQRALGNRQLVQALSAGGAPFEVVVALETDPATASGVRWSSSRGPATRLSAGTLCAASIIIREETVLRLLMPAARRLLPGDAS